MPNLPKHTNLAAWIHPSSQISVFGYMRIVNRQPLNVELLTLDDGTQKIAWDIKQLQSLLGISDLLHQEELSSAANTGVNAAGIPTIETVIAILDELGLKDLYEVRYRKQYATIVPKTESKRPKGALYVVQQQSEIALSVHDKIWTNNRAKVSWKDCDEWHRGEFEEIRELYIPISRKLDFEGRLLESGTIGEEEVISSSFGPISKSISHSGDSLYFNFAPLIHDMIEQNICHELSLDQRFPSTTRISLSNYIEVKDFLSDISKNLGLFLRSNGERPNEYDDIPLGLTQEP